MRTINLFIVALALILISACNSSSKSEDTQQQSAENVTLKAGSEGEVIYLTSETFKQKVFNYEVNEEWNYEGTIPCIVDFYADWCGPCKQVAPTLDELAKEYKGKIFIYKVDTDKQQELASAFGIRSIPSILFIPLEGQPQMTQGAMPKESFVKAIDEVLLGQNKES